MSKQPKDIQKAEALMKEYAQLSANRKALQERIKNEMDSYNKGMKACEEELLEIGARNRSRFDETGNLVLEHGYIHAASNTVVVTSRKFDIHALATEFPEMVDMGKALKLAPIKKAFLDKDLRKALKALGVSTTTEENLQVIAGNGNNN